MVVQLKGSSWKWHSVLGAAVKLDTWRGGDQVLPWSISCRSSKYWVQMLITVQNMRFKAKTILGERCIGLREKAKNGCCLGWTKIPKSFQNLMASWYILYQHGYRPFLQKKWFFLHFPHLATTLKKMPFLHSKNGAKIYKNRFLAIKSCRNML